MLDFPDAPTLGTEFNGFTWNGYGWEKADGGGGGGTPVDAYTKAESDANFVNVPGDTMSGDLSIVKDGPSFVLNSTGTNKNVIWGQENGVTRFQMHMPEAGTGLFAVSRFDDAGAYIDVPLTISRANGNTTLNGNLYVSRNNPNVILNDTGTTGAAVFGQRNAINRWNVTLCNPATNFEIVRYDDIGTPIAPLTIDRATGKILLSSIGSDCLIVDMSSTLANSAIAVSISANTQYYNWFNCAGATTGNISTDGTTTSYNTTSDAALKEDLKSFDAGNIIDATNVYDFAWKTTGERAYGIVAQEAVEVYPNAITHTDPTEERLEWWGVDYSKYVPVLLQEMKAMRERMREMEAELRELRQPK